MGEAHDQRIKAVEILTILAILGILIALSLPSGQTPRPAPLPKEAALHQNVTP